MTTTVSGVINAEPMLQLSKITKTFLRPSGAMDVLADVCLGISEGEVLGIVGPSGCGKTTLIRIIAGLETSTAGSIQLSKAKPVRVGMVFQQPALLGWRTLYENVKLPFELLGEDAACVRTEVVQAIAAVGLQGFEDYLPAEMSGGMQARAALARAIVIKPSLLLLDEVFSSVDEISRMSLHLLLTDLLKRSPTTTILVTHSIPEASLLCDRVAVMSDAPSEIVGEIPINLCRTSRLSDPDSDDLIQIRKKIRGLLERGNRRRC